MATAAVLPLGRCVPCSSRRSRLPKAGSSSARHASLRRAASSRWRTLSFISLAPVKLSRTRQKDSRWCHGSLSWCLSRKKCRSARVNSGGRGLSRSGRRSPLYPKRLSLGASISRAIASGEACLPWPHLQLSSTSTAAAGHRKGQSCTASLLGRFIRYDGPTVDRWVYYALRHAGAALELDLTLHRILDYYTYRRYGACGYRARQEEAAAAAINQQAELDHAASEKQRAGPDEKPPEPESDDDAASSADDDDESRKSLPLRSDTGYAFPRAVFSFAALRSLRLAFCNLCCTPAMAISLPSLSALHLSNVLDDAVEESVQRLVSACPRLAELTLEHCDMAGALSLLRNTRLRSLAVRCCHQLSSLAVDASSELRHFEYRGAAVVPPGSSSASFLTFRSGPGGPPPSVTSCKVATCGGHEEEEEPGDLALHILQPFASTTERLHLSSAHMAGSAFARLPELPSVRSLHLNGRVPHDHVSGLTAATSRVLRRAPGLETLTLFFEPKPHNRHTFEQEGDSSNFRFDDQGAYLDAHHLRYSQYDVLDAPAAAAVPACLRSTVRRIALVHYQGGRAQRTLARFLLRNAVVLEELYCGFAEGPLWVQTELMREMQGWVVSDKASKEFR